MVLRALRALVPTGLALAALGIAACGDGDGAAAGAPAGGGPAVVATTTQVADLARNVAGDRAQVEQMLEPNADPHDYEPRPSDVRGLAGADVVLRSGGDLDAWLRDVLANAGGDARTVTLLDAVPVREDDPHWWQDPRNARAAVGAIRDALVAADPGGRAAYTANAERYAARIAALDAAIVACLAQVPAADRKLVTDHDALGYFAARYDIEVIGTVIPALSTQAQASAGEVAALAETIAEEDVRTIFPSSSGDPRLERALARETGARVGPALYADTLGPEGSPGESYLGALRFNAAAIAEGLGARRCALPPA